MCRAVRDLPDPEDRHVLAAAIVSGSEVIVTDNVADFPDAALAPFNVEARTADVFVQHLLDLSPATVTTTIDQQAAALVNPPMTRDELLDRLESAGLVRSVLALRRTA